MGTWQVYHFLFPPLFSIPITAPHPSAPGTCADTGPALPPSLCPLVGLLSTLTTFSIKYLFLFPSAPPPPTRPDEFLRDSMLLVERCKLFSSSEEQGVIDKPEYRITGTHFQEFLAPWPWVLASGGSWHAGHSPCRGMCEHVSSGARVVGRDLQDDFTPGAHPSEHLLGAVLSHVRTMWCRCPGRKLLGSQ